MFLFKSQIRAFYLLSFSWIGQVLMGKKKNKPLFRSSLNPKEPSPNLAHALPAPSFPPTTPVPAVENSDFSCYIKLVSSVSQLFFLSMSPSVQELIKNILQTARGCGHSCCHLLSCCRYAKSVSVILSNVWKRSSSSLSAEIRNGNT